MGKKMIIVVIVLVLFGLGGGVYLELGGKVLVGFGEVVVEGEGSGLCGGMLLCQGDLILELLVLEDGSLFKVWVECGGKVLVLQEVVFGVDVECVIGEVEDLLFKVSGDGLVVNVGIVELYVFIVCFKLMVGKQGYDFVFICEEGKLELDVEQIEVVGIIFDMVWMISLVQVVLLFGEICFNEDCIVYIVLCLLGIVDSVLVNFGQVVKQGELLVVISSLQLFDQCSEFVVVQCCLSLVQSIYKCEQQLWKEGIFVEQEFLFVCQGLQEVEIVLNNVWVKIVVFGGNFSLQGGNCYELCVLFVGVLVEKYLIQGELVDGIVNVFILFDLFLVWVIFNVFV